MGKTADAAGTKTIQIQVDPSLAAGRYATLALASLGENETLLTFVAEDLMTLGGVDGGVGHAVARVYLANNKVRSIAELLLRQADMIDARESGSASA